MDQKSKVLLSAGAVAQFAALVLKFGLKPPLIDLSDFIAGLGVAFVLGALFVGRRRTKSPG